ncbi:hypothetical protein [Mesorhizobium marinum]|uniref:hypothetical protein n=1 Tax=Mesorhizobium marinum TaxID=3228790 RepID=UPI00346602D4
MGYQEEPGPDGDPVKAAAQWLAFGGADKSRPVIPQLRSKFSLTTKSAVEAIREANLIRARSL